MKVSQAAGQAAIRAEGLGRRFGDLTAVDDLSFEVKRGELFGLVGPDGAGKDHHPPDAGCGPQPTSGDALMNGVSVVDDPESVKADLAYMSQRFGLYTDLTVLENLHFYADLYDTPEKELPARIERLFQFSSLGPFRDRLAGNLSGGMKQKLGLSCALIHEPKILLLDEPTFGVDPISRRDLWLIVHDMVARGVTVVVQHRLHGRGRALRSAGPAPPRARAGPGTPRSCGGASRARCVPQRRPAAACPRPADRAACGAPCRGLRGAAHVTVGSARGRRPRAGIHAPGTGIRVGPSPGRCSRRWRTSSSTGSREPRLRMEARNPVSPGEHPQGEPGPVCDRRGSRPGSSAALSPSIMSPFGPPGRDLRISRAQRRGKDDHHQDAHRPAAADFGQRDRSRDSTS